MESINRYPEYYNLGGTALLEFAPIEDITSLPTPDLDNKVTGPVIFQPGKSWLKIECTEGSIQFSWSEEETDNGSLVTSTISGDIPKLTQSTETKLLFTARKKFIVRFKDNNGYYRIAGTLANPVKLSKKGTLGDKPNSKNGVTINFFWQSNLTIPFYKDGSISIPNEYSS